MDDVFHMDFADQAQTAALHAMRVRSHLPERSRMSRKLETWPCLLQRRPTRLTGPPRFIGVPARTPTPRAPTPGVSTAARATGATGRTTQPALTTPAAQ